jgi:hypothetical protein
MHKPADIIQLLRDNLPGTVAINEADIIEDCKKAAGNTGSAAIKILSVLGGFLASAAFLGFIFIAGLHSGFASLVLGLIGIFSGVAANKLLNNLVLDTAGVTFFITGFILVGIGVNELKGSDNIICLVMILLATTSIVINKGYLIAFISFLIVSMSMLTLININNLSLLIHVYNLVIVVLFVYISVKEPVILSSQTSFADLIGPLRLSLILSLLVGSILVSLQYFGRDFNVSLRWISSAIIIFGILYLARLLTTRFNIRSFTTKSVLYTGIILCLSPTLMFPAIAASILLILGNFYVNYKPGYLIGMLALVYSISQYYYDLQVSLLQKSILLIISGLLMFAVLVISNSLLKSDEQN